jgi:hypothetical protein
VGEDSFFSKLKARLVAHGRMQEWADNEEIVSRKQARDMVADVLTRRLQSASFRYQKNRLYNVTSEDVVVT